MMGKIKRIMHRSEQGLDIVVTFILFQESLPSKQTNIVWASRSENDRNGHALGIAKSKPCAIFANGES
jgi:hypothetical protein